MCSWDGYSCLLKVSIASILKKKKKRTLRGWENTLLPLASSHWEEARRHLRLTSRFLAQQKKTQ